jgi:hypothetical protein
MFNFHKLITVKNHLQLRLLTLQNYALISHRLSLSAKSVQMILLDARERLRELINIISAYQKRSAKTW